jgi:hypothetical protein
MVNEPPTDGSTAEPVSVGRPKDWAAGLPAALHSLQYSQAQMMSAVGCYPAEGEVP